MTDAISRLRDNIRRVFLGNDLAIEQVVCCLLARGHVLIEDVPGVGKTVLAMALARSLDCGFNRLQLTPDMLPADVLGVSVLDRASSEFVFRRGPVFTNILLADEINRTTPRTQTALLEAMNEAQVSIDGHVYRLPEPFMVLATQNPYEFEGTYPLPENQLDRFLMRIRLGYPAQEDEIRVLEQRPAQNALGALGPVMHQGEIVALQASVDDVRLDRALMEYIVALARATREHPEVRIGLSPRGSLALAQAARAGAFFRGRDYVIPEDVLSNIEPVAAHRLVLRAGGDAPGILQSVLMTLRAPA
ncbi:MAG: AAA family ATPase [Phycisphaerales bacterium]|nr:AAA family ATPase [Phycisphaerales bacterium]